VNSPVSPPGLERSKVEPPVALERAARRGRLALPWLARPIQFLWGLIFCQGLLGSVLVVGWSYRFAQRSVLRQWWSRSGRGGQFEDFVAEDPWTRPHANGPNWFLAPRVEVVAGKARGIARWLGGFGRNLSVGLAGLANTSALVLPACLLWWFGWYDGWNNSFAKGYEHAAVGPIISVLGILIFCAVMFYVPLAQARQAVTGNWRAFYDFNLLWTLVRRQWLGCLGLALCYSLLALPLHVLKTLPMLLPQINPQLETLSSAEALEFLRRYFFWCGLWMFPAYVLLRVLAAKLYAGGLLEAVQAGALRTQELDLGERSVLERLRLLEVRPRPAHHFLVRWLRWSATAAGRWVAGFLVGLVWFSFVAQIYITEFFNYHQAQGWLNQPLVQLPWFSYLPASLAHPAREVPLLLLVALVVWLVARKRSERMKVDRRREAAALE
jgi:hypothetical protein